MFVQSKSEIYFFCLQLAFKMKLRSLNAMALIFLSLFPAFSQGTVSDSLKQLAQTASDDSVRVSALLQLAFNTIFNDSKQANEYLAEVRMVLQRRPMTYPEIYCHYVQAVYYDVTGKTDSARLVFQEGLNRSRSHRFPELEVKFLNGLGLNNWNRGYYQTALDLFMQTLQLNDNLEPRYRIPASTPYNNVGLIYQELGLYEKALEYHQKALDIRLSDPKLLAQVSTSYNNIGICLYHLGRLAEAEEMYRKGIDIARKNQFTRQYYDLLGNLVNTLIAQDRLSEALKVVQEILDPKTKVALPEKFIMNQHAAAAGVLIQLNQPHKALEHIQKALQILEEQPELEHYASMVYNNASAAYYMLGNTKLGKAYNDKMKEVLENKFSKRNADAIAEIEVKYETAEKERQLLNTKLEVEEKNLAIARQRNQNILLLAGIIIIALSAGLILLRYRYRQKQMIQQAVIEEQQRGLQAIIRATEEERQRIARDLHDGIGQQLAGLKMKWESISTSLPGTEWHEKVSSITEQLQKTSEDVRNLSHQMMPKSLKEMGLIPALSELFRSVFHSSSIQWEFSHHHADGRFSEQIELALYRTAQEAVSNIIRHAKASRVNIQLYRIKDLLRLNIEDDGIGFNPYIRTEGHGLTNIRTRIGAVHGQVLFEPREQGGTLVNITVPLDPEL